MKMADCLCICMILKSTHMPILQCLDLVIVKQVHISPESAIIVMYCSTKYQSVFDPGWFEFRANDALTATFGNNEILLKPLLLLNVNQYFKNDTVKLLLSIPGYLEDCQSHHAKDGKNRQYISYYSVITYSISSIYSKCKAKFRYFKVGK